MPGGGAHARRAGAAGLPALANEQVASIFGATTASDKSIPADNAADDPHKVSRRVAAAPILFSQPSMHPTVSQFVSNANANPNPVQPASGVFPKEG